MSDVKKSRSPQISNGPFIKAAIALRHSLNRPFTVQELTTFLNTHNDDSGEWQSNAEDVPNGTRNSLSTASKLSQTRAFIEEQEADIGANNVKTLLAVLEVSGAERAKPDLRSMVLNINSLGILAAPANMVPKSGHVGTNGQAVSSLAFVDE